MKTGKIDVVLQIQTPKWNTPELSMVDPELLEQMRKAGDALSEAFARMGATLDEAVAKFAQSIDAIPQETLDEIKAFASQHAPDPDPRQVAHDRSKRDRRRKARGGKYRWGGVADE